MKRLFAIMIAAAVALMPAAADNLAELRARYESGMSDTDGGVMEIISYSPYSEKAYAINGKSGNLAILTFCSDDTISGEEVSIKSIAEEKNPGFAYGDMTSVSVSKNGRTLAAALQAEGYRDNGLILLFHILKDGSLAYRGSCEAGVQPDMVLITDDGYVLTANEGEPREGYSAADPKGSITILNLTSGKTETIDFTAYDSRRDELAGKGIILRKGSEVSEDLEPEYITAIGGSAYVTLQENNAIAIVDYRKGEIAGISSAGFEDYSSIPVDIDKKDEAYNPKTYAGLKGIRMPDGIASFMIDDTVYLAAANEGDSREWGDYLNEDEVDFKSASSSPKGNVTGLKGKVVFFLSSDYDGLEDGTDYLFGGRSMSLYRVEGSEIICIASTKDDAERITAEALPLYFNASNDNAVLDDRSGKKGPEPESVAAAQIDGKTYAFLALERTGGVMIYDVTDPENPVFITYSNTRDFETTIPGSEEYEDGELDKWVTGGDVAPEGLCFIDGNTSPYGVPTLLVANEVSGTVSVLTQTE